MFNLLGEITGYKPLTPNPAKTVQVATKQEIVGFSFEGILATSGDNLLNTNYEIESVATCLHPTPQLKHPESQYTQRLSPLSPVSPPALESFDFLKETPLTKAMIIYGLKQWQQPFDQDDMNEIATGDITLDQAIRYLFFWVRQNHNGYLKLKKLTSNRNISN